MEEESEGGRGGSGVHVYAERGAEINLFREDTSPEEDTTTKTEKSERVNESSAKRSMPTAQSQTPSVKVSPHSGTCTKYQLTCLSTHEC